MAHSGRTLNAESLCRSLVISAVIVVVIYKMHYWVERRFKIDDAVGAVAVHGYAGFLGVVVLEAAQVERAGRSTRGPRARPSCICTCHSA